MKIWKCTKSDKSLGTILSWHASKRDAERELRDWQRENGEHSGYSPESVEPVEIPTTRAGLIDWLNNNFSTDNG